jgi:hypothetical protein
MNNIKIDPKKVEYNGNTIRLIITDEQILIDKLIKKQQEILKDLEERK